ncbi:MAG TPA: hypothetical protein VIU16_16115, partial [Gaiellaceae bacterium]
DGFDPKYVEASLALTDQFRQRLSVGLSPTNFAEAQDYAWEAEKARATDRPDHPKGREIERFRYGVNPLTGYGVVMMWDPTPPPPAVTELLTPPAP